MARRGSSRIQSGKLAVKIGLVTALAGVVGAVIVGLFATGKLSGHVDGEKADEVVQQTYLVAVIIGVVAGLGVGGAAFAVSSGVASRITDLTLAVSKMGRGTKAAVRVDGNDEVSVLARALSALSSDMEDQSGGDSGGGSAIEYDPKIREMRDKTLPGQLEEPEGFEVDAVLTPGSRGGNEYFDGKMVGSTGVIFLVSAAGSGATAAMAARMARDEILRALGAGGNARKALAHTNRVLNKNLPRGVCATATVLELEGGVVKVYQAGARVPVLLCAAGELEDLTAEGLALGLDSGPVFEKGLRSNTVEMGAGVRIVVVNQAGNQNEDLIASILEHSPKHTAPFMSMVLGALEAEAGAGGLREDVVLMTVKKS